MRMRTTAATAALAVLAASAGMATAVAGPTAGATTAASTGNDGRVKNVIYLLGDGMGRTHVDAARLRYYGAAGKLNMEQMPVVGQNQTYSVEKTSGQPGEPDFEPNLVTDSASAA